jgi:hypothetical protein
MRIKLQAAAVALVNASFWDRGIHLDWIILSIKVESVGVG